MQVCTWNTGNTKILAIRAAIRWQFLAIRDHFWQFVCLANVKSVGNPAIQSTLHYPFKILKKEKYSEMLGLPLGCQLQF